MKEIPLSRGMVALVDDEDYERVCEYRWYAWIDKKKRVFYARTNLSRKIYGGKQPTLMLHRFIMNAEKGEQVDHKNRDGLDCQKSNLRIATHTENVTNQGISKRNTSGYIGVSGGKNGKKWKAQISVDKKSLYIGCFDTREEAAVAYNEAALRYHKEYAKQNIILSTST